MNEGQCIQNRLQNLPLGHYANSSARQFDKLMKLGKVKSALRLVSRVGKGNVLSPNSIQSTTDGPRSVLDILIAKHPPSTIPPADILLNGDNVNCLHTLIFFEAITGEVIRNHLRPITSTCSHGCLYSWTCKQMAVSHENHRWD